MEMWQLAARLAESEGYVVYDSDGRNVGHVEHLLYRDHADRPDFVIVRRRLLLVRTRLDRVPFEAVMDVDDEAGFVRLKIPADDIVRG